MNSVVILQKPMHQSKTRLSSFLTAEQRIGLAYSMLYDLLTVVSRVPSINEFSIVTCDPNAIQLAEKFGAKLYFERNVLGINHAIKTVVDSLDTTVKDLLILPSDIPLVRVNELNFIMKQKRKAQVTIFPCKNGTGTNGLLLSPPNVMVTAFGVNSLEKHCQNAIKAGCNYHIGSAPFLSYDIDTITDLNSINELGKGTKTYEYIVEQKILKNLKIKEVVS